MTRIYLENLCAPTYFFGVVVGQNSRTYLGTVNVWKDWVYVTNARVYNYFSHVWFPCQKQLFHASEIKKIVPYNQMNTQEMSKEKNQQTNLKEFIY